MKESFRLLEVLIMDLKLLICLYLMAIGFSIIDHIKQHNYIMWKTQGLRKEIEDTVRQLAEKIEK